jgi:glutamate/tyrosine decarboxylase-like PLP-dependent enzyme
VDACFGGFMLPWIERLGHPVPAWDFRVPGVTSISADVHKYGYAAKGASLLLYRDMDYLKHQFFVSTDWPGGIYASPSMPGTRPGGPIAAAWAAMQAMGEEGYLGLAETALETTRKLRAGIGAIPELQVLGDFHCTSVTWGAREGAVSVYAVADLMAERAWSCDRQQRPPSVHLTVNANNAAVVDLYLADLAECVARAAREPELADEGEAAMYGMMAKVPLRGLVKHSVGKVMEAMYDGSTDMPDLSNLGDDPSAGPVLGFLNRHGDKALGALDKLSSSVRSLRRGPRT